MKEIELILASGSPRRRQLMSAVWPSLTIAPSRDVDETYEPSTPAEQVPVVLSQLKSEAYADIAAEHPDAVVVTADTVVVLDGRILGKPADRDDACRMLAELSGRTHRVVTGVTMRQGERSESFASVTDVTFDTLSAEDIEHYVDTYKPLDKAGAYGVQEWIGYTGVKGINGCYYNVMGLPLHDLYHRLRRFLE